MTRKTLEWTPEYSVGVEIIDEQHKKLFSILDELIRADFSAADRDWQREKLEELIEYMRYHFQYEEELIGKFHPVDLEMHRAQHDEFRRQVAKLYDRWLKGAGDVGDSAIAFLAEWISRHVLEVDRKYGPFM
jgi:hemerythrin-like metal-binding protein